MSMNEEEIVEKIKDYIELLMCDERPLELPSMFQKEWAEDLQALLDLYNKEKEKNKKLETENFSLKEMKRYNKKHYISKDRIREKIKELDNMFECSNEEINHRLRIEDNAKKQVLEELLEE